MECYGNGSCLCICFEEECVCGKKVCMKQCKLISCGNAHCNEKRPAWVLHCNDGLCVTCASSIGKVTFLDETASCPICLDSKEMVQIQCGGKHKVCLDCWIKWSDRNEVTRCMICRGVTFH
jgi:hypothetical protein